MVIQRNRGYASTSSMKSNKMYIPCCRSKSASHENLHDDEGEFTPRVRRPNPIIVGLANHLREHHSSARNSAVAGCFGFPDSPPKYEDIYVEARNTGGPVTVRHQQTGICNVDGKAIIADEGTNSGNDENEENEIDDIPPPSYEESVGMSNSSTNCVVVTIAIEEKAAT